MKRGLIPSQIGLTERVRPQGDIRLSWQAFIDAQIERDEAIMWSKQPKGELRAERTPLLERIRDSLPRFSLRGLIP